MPDEQTLKILADVGPTSPLYPVARRQIAEIHFRQYRRSSAVERATLAARFLQLGGEAMDLGLREIGEAKARVVEAGCELSPGLYRNVSGESVDFLRGKDLLRGPAAGR